MISKFEKSDIDAIIKLGEKINPGFKKLFKPNELPINEQIYVYKNEGDILAFLHVLINIDALEILNLIVEENSRQQGIATLLIDHLLSDPELNQRCWILEVRASNQAALNLYEKFNFYPINTRKNYYGDEDAVVLERSNDL